MARPTSLNGDGIEVTIRRSKTDQEGKGRKIGIPYDSSSETCPVRAVRTWPDAAGIESCPVFRSVTRHGRIVPARLNSAAVAGKPERAIMAETGRRSSAMVRRYIRDAELFVDNQRQDFSSPIPSARGRYARSTAVAMRSPHAIAVRRAQGHAKERRHLC